MYTKTEILKIAKAQLALDYNCKLSDFEKEKNTITENNLTKGRRIYDNDGCFLKILCFGGNTIISISPMFKDFCEEKILNKNAAWLFQYPKLRTIDEELQKYGHQIADIHSQNIAVNSGFFPAWAELYSEKKMHC